ncbi:MAG: nucleolar zinc-finger protein [Alyxoria varia]|nr:MAG: nucleolar zinc-finger protein [Alyxoria varia]
MDTMTASGDADHQAEEVTSLCMNCHEDGTTRLLLVRIPFFREVVLSSFHCPHCHFRNSEIQSAGEIQQRGVSYTFRCDEAADFQRQVVKGDNCTVQIQEVDLEIPPGRGQLTNLEGLLSMVVGDLQELQPQRRESAPEVAQKIDGVCDGIRERLDGRRLPCTIVLRDPSGNSSVEPSPADRGGKYVRREFARSKSENETLGLSTEEASEQPEEQTQNGLEEQPDTNGATATAPPSTIRPEYSAASHMYPAPPPHQASTNPDTADNNTTTEEEDDIIQNKVYTFPTACPGCTRPSTINMKMVSIPHFADVVIMSTVCPSCGYRSNEVKSGGPVGEKGRRIVLTIRSKEDLSRDILKAESCRLECPELSLNVEPGTLGGRFTTVEGLLAQVRDDLKANVFDAEGTGADASGAVPVASGFAGGDSMPESDRGKWNEFFGKLDAAISGEILEGGKSFTVILTDPLASSYVQSFTAPDPDAQIEVREYDRTAEEEDELGITDMKTEGYEGDPNLRGGGAGDEKADGGKAKVDDASAKIDGGTNTVKPSNKTEPNGANGASDITSSSNGVDIDVDEIQAAVQERMKQLEVLEDT